MTENAYGDAMIETTNLRRYRLFGLTISSEIALPELIPAIGQKRADVMIMAPPANLSINDTEPGVLGGEVLLDVPGVAAYRMLAGERIFVAARDGATERDVRLFLLGSAFAVILHQRGMLPLHSSAFEIQGQAVAFLGHSGAGKSTLATWFHDRGYGILSDDVCVVETVGPGSAVAHAGVPRLRLWRDALEASGRHVDAQERAFRNLDKYNVQTIRKASNDHLLLSHVYVIHRDEAKMRGVAISRMSGARAVEALVANTYRGRYIRDMGSTKRHLDQCVRLAQKVAIYEVQKPWGLGNLGKLGTTLESHARENLGKSLPSGND